MAAVGSVARPGRVMGVTVVLAQELRDLWLGGRALALGFAFSLLLSVLRVPGRDEPGAQLPRAAGDGEPRPPGRGRGRRVARPPRSGRRHQRRTRARNPGEPAPHPGFESRAGRRQAAWRSLSLWLAAFAISVPYVWFLGRGVGIVGDALAVGFVVGTLLAVFLASLGILISVFAGSNRVSLSVGPLRPTRALRPDAAALGRAARLDGRPAPAASNPMTAGEHYVGKIVVDGHGWGQDAYWLASPLIAALVFSGIALAVSCPLRHAPRRVLAMSRRWTAAVLVVVTMVAAASAAKAEPRLGVTVDRASVRTKLGHTFVIRSRVTNRGPTPAPDLIAHLNVLSLNGDVYVDPEDWSSHRTRYLRPLPPHGSTTLRWKLDAVNAGDIGVYVAVLPRTGLAPVPTAGPLVRVAIAHRRTLNAGGILPLALGVPALLGVLAVALSQARRRHQPAWLLTSVPGYGLTVVKCRGRRGRRTSRT